MECSLTENGRDLIEITLFVTIALTILSIPMIIIGWIQLNIFGIALTPNVPIDTVIEYYLYTGSVGFSTLLVLSGIALATHNGDVGLPKLFTCSKKV
jgi:hypothetical protein